jgi:hypothetical protein
MTIKRHELICRKPQYQFLWYFISLLHTLTHPLTKQAPPPAPSAPPYNCSCTSTEATAHGGPSSYWSPPESGAHPLESRVHPTCRPPCQTPPAPWSGTSRRPLCVRRSRGGRVCAAVRGPLRQEPLCGRGRRQRGRRSCGRRWGRRLGCSACDAAQANRRDAVHLRGEPGVSTVSLCFYNRVSFHLSRSLCVRWASTASGGGGRNCLRWLLSVSCITSAPASLI